MKHLLYIILLSLLFFSACKSQAEQKQQEAVDWFLHLLSCPSMSGRG